MSSKPMTAAKFSDGQRVQIADKPIRPAEQKGTPYYSFYNGLTGTILHTYPDETSSVDIDQDSLPQSIRKRHEKSESQLREKWLGDSADDDPNQATTGKVRGLKLRYMLLVANDDLLPFAGARADSSAAPKAQSVTLAEPAAKPAAQATADAKAAPPDSEPARATLDEIAGKEQAYLDEITRRAQQ